MSLIRVLVAEDSPTARCLLVDMLKSDAGITVVGEARNGVEAVELAKRLRPDIITMDVQMPDMDGIEATRQIMIDAPAPIVIVSALAVHETTISIAAIDAGALTAIAKPAGPSSPGFEDARRAFLATVRSMAAVKVVRRWPVPSAAVVRPTAAPSASSSSFEIIALAASTGGPAALHQILSALPAPLSAPILVVQHMALGFAAGLAGWLRSVTKLHVVIASDGMALAPGAVYLPPDDRHLAVSSRGKVSISNAEPVGGFRPSADFLFQSVARAYGATALGVILTGMGEDGSVGLAAIKAARGRVIAQDEASSVVFGMPGAAIARGVVHEIISLGGIAARLSELAGKGENP